MGNKVNTNFPITVYGKMEKFSDTISKGRCRIFYKGGNRNGTYITDDFAEKLMASAPYAPVKGIYDGDDYTDHGKERTEGRIYGIVPANPNFTWEKHVDCDGVEREYACCDVLYYTALYKEAAEIDGKSQSMELFRKTLKGAWQYINGKKYYVFSEGGFLGLQALGDDVEPCFEGAGFYSKEEKEESTEEGIIALLRQYEQRTDIFQNHEQGGNIMPEINFKISDGQKYEYLWSLLNPNYNEAGDYTMEYVICEVYEDYAVVRNLAENTFERVYYAKNDENDSLEITNKERCYIVDINQEEKDALDNLHTAAGATFAEIGESYATQVSNAAALGEQIEALNTQVGELNTTIEGLNTEITRLNDTHSTTVENYESQISELNTQISDFGTKIGEHEATISTLNTENETLNASLSTANDTIAAKETELTSAFSTISTLTAERDELAAYKAAVIREQKTAMIMSYSAQLTEEIIDSFIENIDNYALDQLDMILTYEVKKLNPALFSKQTIETPTIVIPKDDNGAHGGINHILSKYEK